jgi:sugar phosphate permease
VLAPALRDEFGLSLTEVGILLSAAWFGATFTLLPWGLAADRIGERWAITAGIGLCGLGFAAAAFAQDFRTLCVLLALAGAAGSSVNSASGRAVMAWFPPEQRGLALGIRQAAIPIGGALAALALPTIEHAGGIEAAFVAIACVSLVGAAAALLVIRDPPREPSVAEAVPRTLRDRRLWLLCASGGCYVIAQIALISFVVLYLHDERGWSDSAAAAVLAAIQVLAVAARIGAGAWSDRVRSRVGPLRLVGVATAITVGLVAVLLDSPTWLVVGAFVAAGVVAMSWNGLSFAAAAEFGGYARSGAAIGMQQTALGIAGLAAPVVFTALVSTSGWQAAYGVAALFPLAGWALLAPLASR